MTTAEIIIILLPVAFLHGWWLGRQSGIEIGAEMTYEYLYDIAKPTSEKGVRLIELRNDDEAES